MNKLLIILIIVLFASSVALFYKPHIDQTQKSISKIVPTSTVSPTNSQTAKVPEKSSIFIPYWTDFSKPLSVDSYDRLIYFGISPTYTGINTGDIGYLSLDDFTTAVGESTQEKYLTVRMLDTDTNMTILKNRKNWPQIADKAIEIAQEYKFNGLLLDLELSTIPTTNVSTDINDFVKEFHNRSRAANLRFMMTVYGDTFYRARPFDLQTLNSSVDEFLVMAYDLHKAHGEAGPNFPLRGKDKYGYDMVSMVHDIKIFVPVDKITVIFGMYGYDWAVDEKKRPLKAATAISYGEIKEKILADCPVATCIARRDEEAAETEINYVQTTFRESDNYYLSNPHIIWFEDTESVQRKINFLQSQGIGSTAYWVYGYF